MTALQVAGGAETPETSVPRARGLSPDQRRERRVQRTLDAALSLFAQQGYWATSVEQIAQRAKVSTKSFYEVFSNKQDCFARVLDRIVQRIESELTLPRHVAQASDVDAVSAVLESFVHALISDTRLIRILFSHPGPEASEFDQQHRAVWHTLARAVESVWERFGAVGSGVARRPSPRPRLGRHKTVLGLVGGVHQLIGEWLADADLDSAPDVDALTNELVLFYETFAGSWRSGQVRPETHRPPVHATN